MPRNAAWVSLLSRTEYLAGLLVVDYGLRAAKSKYPLIVMVTPNLPKADRDVLRKRGLKMFDVGRVSPDSSRQNFGEEDSRFLETWSKIRTFEMVDYDRVVLLDADMIVMKNMDELMDIDLPKGQIAAAHVCACNPRRLPHYPTDWIPANCAHTAVLTPTSQPPVWTEGKPRPYSQLNSGVVVLDPSMEMADAIHNRLSHSSTLLESFTFADQDLLIEHFKGMWIPLPWYYNALRTLKIVHPNLWHDDEVRVLHYILSDKPWMARVPAAGTGPFDVVNRWWWDHFEALGKQIQATDPEGWKLVLSSVAPALEE